MYKCKPNVLARFCWNIISLLVQALLLYQVFFPLLFLSSPFSSRIASALEEAHNVQQQHCHFESTCVNRARWLHYDAAPPWDRVISTATPLLFSLRCLILFGRKCSCTRCVAKWTHRYDRSLRQSEHCWEIASIPIYFLPLLLFCKAAGSLQTPQTGANTTISSYSCWQNHKKPTTGCLIAITSCTLSTVCMFFMC